MEINIVKDELIKYGKLLFLKNLSSATSGNLSFRYGENFLITTSGSCLGDLNYSDIVLIDKQGNLLEGKQKPSSEKNLHVETYNIRPDVNAIFHTHSPWATAFAVAGIEMSEPILAEFVYYFGKIPLAKYAMPSSAELVGNTVKLLESNNAALMANHGLIVCAKDVKTAFYYTEMIESYAKIYYIAKGLGQLKTLSSKEIELINQMV